MVLVLRPNSTNLLTSQSIALATSTLQTEAITLSDPSLLQRALSALSLAVALMLWVVTKTATELQRDSMALRQLLSIARAMSM